MIRDIFSIYKEFLELNSKATYNLNENGENIWTVIAQKKKVTNSTWKHAQYCDP